jgi:hypothetical protein
MPSLSITDERGGESSAVLSIFPAEALQITWMEAVSDRVAVAVTPSLMTRPAPTLPVSAILLPPTRRKYPEMWPGQNAVTFVGFMFIWLCSKPLGVRIL